MSEQEIKSAGELEDTLGIVKTEISEVTIVEYRKNQIVRLAECAVGGGLVVVGIKYRKQLGSALGISLALVGAGMFVYNGRNLYKNWNQDGKLIREAIKNKKVEEKKIREERKGKSSSSERAEPNANDKSSEKKEILNGNNSVVAEKVAVKKSTVQSANITEPEKAEGVIISATVKEEIESPSIEATVTSAEIPIVK